MYMQEKKNKSEAKKLYWSSKSIEDRRELVAKAVEARWLNVDAKERSAHGKRMVEAREALKGQKLTVVDSLDQ